MHARAHVELFLANSHRGAHFPEEVYGCNDLGTMVWGTEPSVNLLKTRTHLHVQKYVHLNVAQRLITATQPEAVSLSSADVTALPSKCGRTWVLR
jgi:hypothetical protein